MMASTTRPFSFTLTRHNPPFGTSSRTVNKIARRVAVVGGGYSGLVAALKCYLAGFEVLVFEKEAQVGGRARSLLVRNGFVTVDSGAQFFNHSYQQLLELAVLVGVNPAEVVPVDNTITHVTTATTTTQEDQQSNSGSNYSIASIPSSQSFYHENGENDVDAAIGANINNNNDGDPRFRVSDADSENMTQNLEYTEYRYNYGSGLFDTYWKIPSMTWREKLNFFALIAWQGIKNSLSRPPSFSDYSQHHAQSDKNSNNNENNKPDGKMNYIFGKIFNIIIKPFLHIFLYFASTDKRSSSYLPSLFKEFALFETFTFANGMDTVCRRIAKILTSPGEDKVRTNCTVTSLQDYKGRVLLSYSHSQAKAERNNDNIGNNNNNNNNNNNKNNIRKIETHEIVVDEVIICANASYALSLVRNLPSDWVSEEIKYYLQTQQYKSAVVAVYLIDWGNESDKLQYAHPIITKKKIDNVVDQQQQQQQQVTNQNKVSSICFLSHKLKYAKKENDDDSSFTNMKAIEGSKDVMWVFALDNSELVYNSDRNGVMKMLYQNAKNFYIPQLPTHFVALSLFQRPKALPIHSQQRFNIASGSFPRSSYSSPILFAGDYLMGSATIESAILSGQLAANSLVNPRFSFQQYFPHYSTATSLPLSSPAGATPSPSTTTTTRTATTTATETASSLKQQLQVTKSRLRSEEGYDGYAFLTISNFFSGIFRGGMMVNDVSTSNVWPPAAATVTAAAVINNDNRYNYESNQIRKYDVKLRRIQHEIKSSIQPLIVHGVSKSALFQACTCVALGMKWRIDLIEIDNFFFKASVQSFYVGVSDIFVYITSSSSQSTLQSTSINDDEMTVHVRSLLRNDSNDCNVNIERVSSFLVYVKEYLRFRYHLEL